MSIGTQFIYLQCDGKARPQLEKYISILTDMSSLGYKVDQRKERQVSFVEKEIEKAIFRSQGALARARL